jgi:hypothetical protein
MDFEIFTMVPTVGAGLPASGTCMWMISAGWLLLFFFFITGQVDYFLYLEQLGINITFQKKLDPFSSSLSK